MNSRYSTASLSKSKVCRFCLFVPSSLFASAALPAVVDGQPPAEIEDVSVEAGIVPVSAAINLAEFDAGFAAEFVDDGQLVGGLEEVLGVMLAVAGGDVSKMEIRGGISQDSADGREIRDSG